MTTDGASARRLIAEFMGASSKLEAYLQKGGPLTPLELESFTLTVDSVQNFIAIWKRKNAPKE